MEINYGNCKFCGEKNVKSPKTGKIFCSKKCWLNNPTGETASGVSTGNSYVPPKKDDAYFAQIRKEKNENINHLNAKTGAIQIVLAMYQKGDISFEDIKNFTEEWIGVLENL